MMRDEQNRTEQLLQTFSILPRDQVTVGRGAPLALQTSRRVVPVTAVSL